MAIKTKEQLKALSESTFFDNNEGQITPASHRAFIVDLIDSMGTQGGGGSSLDLGVQSILLSQVSGHILSIDPGQLMSVAVGGASGLKNGNVLTVEVFNDTSYTDINTIDISDALGLFDLVLFSGEAGSMPPPSLRKASVVYTFTCIKPGETGTRLIVNASTYQI